jgi:hypothetical protein
MRTMSRGLVLAALVITGHAWAQADAGVEVPVVAEPAVSPSMFEVLASEVRRLKEDLALPVSTYQSFAGLGPAASKVYFTPRGLSLGGYGEANYRFQPLGGSTGTDIERLVLYVGYRFTDRIVLNSEIEFEHGGTEHGGAVNVEFAYLDFKLTEVLSVRVGNVLIPMGFINEIHEPPFFFGVSRPTVEHDLIPATWNENGVGVYGEFKGLRYRAYVVNGLRATNNGVGFSSEEWIREGRQGGAAAIANTFAGVAAVDYTWQALRVGVSGYAGRSGQGQVLDGAVVNGDLLLGEAHAAFQYQGFWLRGLLAAGHLGDADRISAANGTTVGQDVLGGYVEAAYDVLSAIFPGGDQALSPFVRYESLDTHKTVAAGTERDPAQSRQLITAGLHYRPIPNVVVKADYQHIFPGAGAQRSSVNLGVGFVF